jgi:hypothetical protein
MHLDRLYPITKEMLDMATRVIRFRDEADTLRGEFGTFCFDNLLLIIVI